MEVPVRHTGQINQAETISTRKSNNLTAVLMFMVSPFMALLIAMKRYKAEWAKNVVWFFVVYYGYTLVIIRETMDAASYRDRLLLMVEYELTFSNFWNFVFSDETNYVDIAQPLITFGVSLFTDDYRVLFAVFGLIFGYFYSRNIWYLLDRAEPYIRKECIPVIITFALVIGFWQINGFRMWTAAHIFFYGAIQFILDGKKKGILIAASSMLMHFSFMFPVALLSGFAILQNRTTFYYIFYVSTFFLSELDLGIVREILTSILPETFHGRVESYASQEYADSRTGRDRSFHAMYYGRALRWTIIIFMSILFFKGRHFFKENKSYNALYGFSLLFLGTASMLSVVPSVGRFLNVANLFALATIFYYLQNVQKDLFMKRFLYLLLPALIFYSIVAFRIGADTIGILAVIGNPIIAMFGNIEIALIEFLK